MKNVFYKIVILTFLLNGCAKTAPESAAEVAMHQVNAIQAKIEKECPQAELSIDILVLKSAVKNQLVACEDRIQIYRERNNTLWLAIIAMVALWLFSNWAKIKSRIFK